MFLSCESYRLGEPRPENLSFEGEYHPSVGYGASKTADIWTASEIDRCCGTKGLHASAVHPGGIITELQRHMPMEAKVGMSKLVAQRGKSPEQGAATTI